MELPANGQTLTGVDHQVVGLPAEENKRFWAAENKFNSRLFLVMNASIVLNWLIFDVQLFLVRFEDANLTVYILVQALHVVNGNVYIWHYLHSMYTLSALFIECMWFQSKKFRHICQQVQNLRATRTKLIHNHRLAKLIRDYNEVMSELTDINDFFKDYLGHNLLHFGGISVFVTFLCRNFECLFF